MKLFIFKKTNVFFILFFGATIIFYLFIHTTAHAQENDDVLIGVNVFDPYFTPPPTYGQENSLQESYWHYRLPFYANILDSGVVEVRDDNQVDIDKQIQYAAAAGIDYLSFVYWDFQDLNPPENMGDMNHFLRFYLSSPYKGEINFALTVSATQIERNKNSDSYTEDWDQNLLPNLIRYMSLPQYQTVTEDNRPIVYILHPENIENEFGSKWKAKHAIQRIRNRAEENNLNNPYLVAMIKGNHDPVYFVETLGFDAVSMYTMHTGTTHNNGVLQSYFQLTLNNINNWRKLYAKAPMIPTVNVGWDYRPRLPEKADDYQNSPLFKQPKYSEFRSHIINTINWVKARPLAVPSQTMYIYSWAEFPEGGWLTPSHNGSAYKLKALAAAQGLTYIDPFND